MMYPQRSVMTLCHPVVRDHSLSASLLLILYTCLSTYSARVQAEQVINNPASLEHTTTPFYQQLQQPGKNRKASGNSGLLQQVTVSNLMFDMPPANREQDDDLAFNYLWMQQYQQGYIHKGGGAAVSKLLRMSVKSMYSTYTGSASSSANNDDISHSLSSDLGYRLRLSGDKVRLGIEYQF